MGLNDLDGMVRRMRLRIFVDNLSLDDLDDFFLVVAVATDGDVVDDAAAVEALFRYRSAREISSNTLYSTL